MRISLGADPEVFVENPKGEYVSAHGMIPGTKQLPHKVRNGAVQVDGMALEYNIDPCYSRDSFIRRNLSVLKQLKQMIPARHKLAINPVADFGADMIARQPFEARQLGCEPDYNAYTMRHNVRPDENVPFRTAAGHIHIGFTKDMDVSDPQYLFLCGRLVKRLDTVLYRPAALNETPEDRRRRELYGKKGAFRPKPYGLEYRPLSNFWLRSPQLMGWVWDGVMRTMIDRFIEWDYFREPPR